MNLKKLLVFVGMIAVVLSTVGFSAPVPVQAPAAADKEIRIVVMPKLIGIDYYNAVKIGVDKAADELKGKAKVEWIGPTDATVDAQIEMLETIIPTKPDVICVAANDAEAIVPVLKKASDAGIKVMTWDGDANFRSFFVSLVDYTVFGNSVIDSLASQINNEGKVAIITTTLTAPNQVNWIKAINARIKEKYPKITIIDTRPAGEDTQKANQLAQDLIKTNPDLKGIIALGAPNLPGALDAVKAASMVGKVIVAGNSTPNMVKSYLKDGGIKDVELWSAPDHGYLTVFSAYELATNGLTADKPFKAGTLGEFTPKKDDVSISISLPLMIFTKDNVEQFNF
jgi:ABC-type sugar transport system substrate-binding protein